MYYFSIFKALNYSNQNQLIMKPKMTSKLKLLLVVLLMSNLAVNAQNENYLEQSNQEGANFFEIVQQTRAEFNAIREAAPFSKAQEKAHKLFERWVYAWQDRVNQDGSFPSAANNLLSKNEYINLLTEEQNNDRSMAQWVQVGPVNNPNINGYTAYPGKGRVSVVAQDPTSNNTMYAGSCAGGVWKTTDGGATWVAKSDNLAGLGVTDLLIDPNNTSIIYMATGDEDANHISSIGIFKSVDAGNTWQPTGLTYSLTDNEYIRDLAFAPGSSTKIFALTNDEIKVSADSGATWANSPTGTNFTEGFQTIIFDPNDANKVVASDQWGGLYFSTDGGNNFALHAIFQGGNSTDKLKLTSTAADNDFFYAISQDLRDGNNNITQEADFRKYRYALDNTAADLVSTTQLTGFNSQGGYNQVITVSPTDKNNIVVAGVNGYKSTDGGASFSMWLNAYNNPPGVGFYVHPDHHHMEFLADGVTLVNGHDGGVHKGPFTATTAAPWTPANDHSPGLNITQPYHVSVTNEMNGDNFMMGNQDNDGFSKVLKDGTRQWVSCLAGDGTATGIDIANSNIRYLGGTLGSLNRTDDGYSSSFNSAIQILGGDPGAAFVSTMKVHPTVAATIYASDNDVKRSPDRGASWVTLNSGLTGVSHLDVTANGGSIRIYAIGNEGARRSDDDGATWTTINPPAGLAFNSFSAMPNTTTAYATVSGYSAGNKVFKTIDGGVVWTPLSGGLPNIIMKKVLVKVDNMNETLFLGTELGVYWKNNTMANWLKQGTGLPNVRIADLEINYTDQTLYTGTFGRGMFRIAVDNGSLGVNDSFTDSEKPIIFPNPATNEFNIQVSEQFLSNNYSYTIFNVVGGIVKEGAITRTNTQINTGSMGSGMYLIRINTDTNSLVSKLIVK